MYTIEQLLEELQENLDWGYDQLGNEEITSDKSDYEIAHFEGGLATLERVVASLQEIIENNE